MIIQHNIPALNAHRNLAINNSLTAKNLEKLSSGYRINRAADDAAGLAISEKMRGQIRGLAMAEMNVDNGISLIQTAEGGLNETHAILHRMRELAVQASNGTYQDDDREQIALEVQALKSEIDRIATSTHYNGIKLLDGTLGGVAGTVGNLTTAFSGAVTLIASATGLFDEDALGTLTVTREGTNAYIYSIQVGDQTYTSLQGGGTVLYLNGMQTENGVTNPSIGISAAPTLATNVTEVVISGLKMTDSLAATAGQTIGAILSDNSRIATDASKLVFQIGANGGADQKVGLHVNNMSSGALGTLTNYTVNNITYNGTVASINVYTRETANKAIEVIDAATQQVSSQRSQLGALQNRMEHTLNNLGVTKENLTAAESTIRDVDMAKEMMEFTKNNILVQSAQAMLAQANALPQGVLSLLR